MSPAAIGPSASTRPKRAGFTRPSWRPGPTTACATAAAIVDWLAETVAGADKAVIVLYENGRVPSIVRNQSLDADIDVLATRAFVDAMERRRGGVDGPSYWDLIEAAEPTTNSRVQSFSQRRPRA